MRNDADVIRQTFRSEVSNASGSKGFPSPRRHHGRNDPLDGLV
jgi:hypothetical protein